MTGPFAIVCASCPAGQAGLAGQLRAAFAEAGLALEVRETDCLSGCARASSVAFRAEGRMAYLFGEITAADLPDLVTFARLWLAAPDGALADARPLGALRAKALARIPA